MKKRALSLLLASFAVTAVMCGCGGKSNGSIIILDGEEQTQTTAMKVYGHITDRNACNVIENAMQSFMSANSEVSVIYEGASDADYWKAFDRRHKTGNLDDVFMLDRDRLLNMQDELADLSDAVDISIFDEISRSQLSADGGIYAVPASISICGLYVNYDLLEKHKQRVPMNLSEFTAVCDYFISAGTTPVLCDGANALRAPVSARGMYGVYCTDGTAEKIEKFNSEPVSLTAYLNEGIDFVYEMLDKGWLNFGGAAEFAKGETPFMIAEGQTSSALKEMLSSSGKSLSYGVHALPVLDSGSVLVAKASSLLSVKKGEKQAQAKALVSLMTSPEVLFDLNYGQSCFSPLRQAPFNSDSAIIPSASYLTKGKYVLGSDINLKIPLDGILLECTQAIINGESSATTKALLENALKEVRK